jgi:hypothetical protein
MVAWNSAIQYEGQDPTTQNEILWRQVRFVWWVRGTNVIVATRLDLGCFQSRRGNERIVWLRNGARERMNSSGNASAEDE